MTQPRRVHYVLSTHWDREWYQSFQDYRHRLVQLLDRVLAGIAEGHLQGPFQTDGQAIILEDYLEVRPERQAEIEQLAQAGKLVIGPWYVMPDEFLVSGESLIRNLRLGRSMARAWGGVPSQAGFVCDIFGHNSQLPQIFAGFGIKGGFIWRGTNITDTRHVRWRGADGTELLVYRFGHIGYCTLAIELRHAWEPNYVLEIDKTAAELEAHIQAEALVTPVAPILLFDGCDHLEWDPKFYEAFERVRPAGYEVAHTSLDAYLEEMLADADDVTTLLEGELREPGFYSSPEENQWVIPGVLSSRVWIKQWNTLCENLLCQWAEPLSTFASQRLGLPYPQGFLNVAWHWLLQNHPHDSIGGCSIDIVHEDMKYRFSQAGQIANRLSIEAANKLAASVEGELADDELRLVVFNALPHPLAETAELTLQIPNEWRTFNEFFGFEPKSAFRIYTPDGQEIPYQRLGQVVLRTQTRVSDVKLPQNYLTNAVRVSLPLSLPALGYTTLTVRQGEKDKPTRHPTTPGLATSERSMENEFLAVTFEPNGSLSLLDKRTNERYERLLIFEDCADIGDGWYHGQTINDQTFFSTGCQAEIAMVENGKMVTTFRIRQRMAVPRIFHFDQMTRSDTFIDLQIDSLVTLRPGAARLEVQTTIQNQASDHRVRVVFPSGARTATTYLADSPFDVVERPIALRQDNHLYRELEIETKPQSSWTAVYSDQRGLAILSTGLKESAVCDLPERPIALTLFRSTQRTVNTNGEPNGQLHGTWQFRYWIVPLTGEPDRLQLCHLSQQLGAGLRTAQLVTADINFHRGVTSLPTSDSFLEVNGAVMTSLRHVGEGREVRLFNPTTQSVTATLAPVQHAQRLDFESNPLGGALPLKGNTLKLTFKPKEIITLGIS